MDRANLTGQGYYEMITNTTEVIPSSASSTFAWEFYKIIPCKNVATILLQLRRLLPELLSSELVMKSIPIMKKDCNKVGKLCRVGIELHASVIKSDSERKRRSLSAMHRCCCHCRAEIF